MNLIMVNHTIRKRILFLCYLLFIAKTSAQTEIIDFCFDIGLPANASSIVLSDPDDNPYSSQTIGELTFQVRYKEVITDPWSIAGSVDYLMQVDANGFLVDPGGTLCADFGGTIFNVSQIEISMSVNANEWQATGLDPWTLDNVVLSNGFSDLIVWDYDLDGNTSFVDPLITSNGGLGDTWSGDLTSPIVTGGALEFIFPEGGGGGSSFIYDVATVPEPNSLLLLSIGACAWWRRRR